LNVIDDPSWGHGERADIYVAFSRCRVE
jgi:hypothetical protein